MGWAETLHKLTTVRADRASVNGSHHARPAASLCVASGKGGTGKSVVTASLAVLLAERGRTLIVDGDLGVGNAHILHDVCPERSLVDVVQGRCSVRDVVVTCGERLALVGGGSGVSHMTGLERQELGTIARGIAQLETEHEFVLVDSAAGVSRQTVELAAACDEVLVVTTLDPTALTDAYALIKVLHAQRPTAAPLLVVNRMLDEDEHADERAIERLCAVCRKFLQLEPRWIGSVPDDRNVVRSVSARAPIVRFAPEAPASRALRSLAELVRQRLARCEHRGFGRSLAHATGNP